MICPTLFPSSFLKSYQEYFNLDVAKKKLYKGRMIEIKDVKGRVLIE